MSDAYAYWRALLAGQDAKPYILPTMYTGTYEDPQPGAYKVRLVKGGPKVPMRIWLVKDGAATAHWSEGCELAGTIDGKPVDAKALADRWMWVWAVSKSDLEHYAEHKLWPGEIGHNSGDLSYKDQIADLADQIGKLQIKDKTSCDKAANYRQQFLDLRAAIDGEREEKVRPHITAQRAINEEYKPLISLCQDHADALRSAAGIWLATEEKRRKDEFEKLKAVAAEKNIELPLSEPPKVQAGGQRGRKVGLKTVVRYEVEDIAKVMAALADNAELQAEAAAIARKILRAGGSVPGMKTIEERVAA